MVGEKMRAVLANLKGSIIQDEQLQEWLLELDIDSMKCTLKPMKTKQTEEPIEKTYERTVVEIESVESKTKQKDQPKLRPANKSS